MEGVSKTPLPKPKGVTRSILLQPKHLVPIYPLLGMLGIALGLAGLTAVRQLGISPTVMVDKKKRASEILPEMEHAEEISKTGKKYAESSPLYLLSKGHMP